jgi:3-hydroxybutyrate dehydrogenase
MHTPMSETTYSAEARAKWVDPARLAPAFALLARRPLHLSGQRLDAWKVVEQGG